MNPLSYYNDNAFQLSARYQRVDPDSLYSSWSAQIPVPPGLALDVGGGSGRDSRWLAEKGWRVIAVEPAAGMRKCGREATRLLDVAWFDDRLPKLASLESYRHRFGLILVGGVLMHLCRDERAESMRTLAALLADSSLLVVTLREGPDVEGRDFYRVSSAEIAELAAREALQVAATEVAPDRLGRSGVRWRTVVIKKQRQQSGSGSGTADNR